MKVEAKRRWVAALRSGEYDQTRGMLTEISLACEKKHCCLGLLCDLVKDELGLDVTNSFGRVYYDESGSVLPEQVSQRLGLSEYGGVPSYNFWLDPNRTDDIPEFHSLDDEAYVTAWVSTDAARLHLASLNDGGLTFDQIADIIEWGEPEE